jgi:hypothetical protein
MHETVPSLHPNVVHWQLPTFGYVESAQQTPPCPTESALHVTELPSAPTAPVQVHAVALSSVQKNAAPASVPPSGGLPADPESDELEDAGPLPPPQPAIVARAIGPMICVRSCLRNALMPWTVVAGHDHWKSGSRDATAARERPAARC